MLKVPDISVQSEDIFVPSIIISKPSCYKFGKLAIVEAYEPAPSPPTGLITPPTTYNPLSIVI